MNIGYLHNILTDEYIYYIDAKRTVKRLFDQELRNNEYNISRDYMPFKNHRIVIYEKIKNNIPITISR